MRHECATVQLTAGANDNRSAAALPVATRVNRAVLNAIVNPEGQNTSYYFQFGTSTSYGLQTLPVSVGSGTSAVSVHRHPQGLLAGTTYHYRVVADNAGGVSYGAD
jgi:hypothetical protein